MVSVGAHSISEIEYGRAENRARDCGFGRWSAEIESPHESPFEILRIP